MMITATSIQKNLVMESEVLMQLNVITRSKQKLLGVGVKISMIKCVLF